MPHFVEESIGHRGELGTIVSYRKLLEQEKDMIVGELIQDEDQFASKIGTNPNDANRAGLSSTSKPTGKIPNDW